MSPSTSVFIAGLWAVSLYMGVFFVCYDRISVRYNEGPILLWVHADWLWGYPRCMEILGYLYRPVWELQK